MSKPVDEPVEESPVKSGGCLDGCLKLVLVSTALGFVAVLLLGVLGGLVYMNREKLGVPPMEEWAKHFEMQLNGTGKEVAAGSRKADESVADNSYVQKRPIAAQAPLHVNGASFALSSKRTDVLVLVDYYADWCGPCKRLAPSLEKLAKEHGDKVLVLKVNVDSDGELAQQAGVRAIPDVRLLHGGEEVDRFIGLIPYEQIEGLVLKYESLLPPPKKVTTLKPSSGEGSIDPITKKYLPPGMSRK